MAKLENGTVLEVSVTERHIKNGRPGYSAACMITKAIRAFGFKTVGTYPYPDYQGSVKIIFRDKAFVAKLPAVARAKAAHFDNFSDGRDAAKIIKPFSFKLKFKEVKF